jgi:hypothetical protein
MKNNPFMRTALAVVLAITLAGCDFGALVDLGDTLKVVVDVPPVETTMPGSFTNAATGTLVSTPIVLSVEGPVRDGVVEALDFSRIDGRTLQGGVINMALRDGIRPSAANPVEFTLVARAAGYLDTRVDFRLVEKGQFEFTAAMIEKANPPEGIAIGEVTATATSGGAMTRPISLSVENGGVRGGSASVHVGQDAVLRDASGNALSGPISTSLSFADGLNQQAMRALFPGYSRATIVLADGTTVQRSLAAAEAAATLVVRDSAGRIAREVDGEFALSLHLPEQAGKAGRVFEVFSLRGGTWVYAGEMSGSSQDMPLQRSAMAGKSSEPPSAMLLVQKGAWQEASSECPLRVEISGRQTHPVALTLELRDQSGGLVSRQSVPGGQSIAELAIVPAGFSGYVRAFFEGYDVGQATISGCATQPSALEVNLAPPALPEGLLIGEIEVTFGCRTDIELGSFEVTVATRRQGFGGAPRFSTIRALRESMNDPLVLRGEIFALFPSATYDVMSVDQDGKLTVLFDHPVASGAPSGPGRARFSETVDETSHPDICRQLRDAVK